MKILSRDGFQQARAYLVDKARLLEWAIFRHDLEGGDVAQVWTEMAAYQNPDGGFGQGLEPDLRTPSSSALATGMALHKLKESGCSADHTLVQKAVAYLLDSCDQERSVWRVVPPDANRYPHAPWWHDEDGSLENAFDSFRIIPRVLILAALNHYASLVPGDWLDSITQKAVRYIEQVDVLGEGGGSDLEYAIKLAETENLPDDYAVRLRSRIKEAIPDVVVGDQALWDTYCIKPLGVVPAPDALGAELIMNEIEDHLDYKVEHQAPGGYWGPTWTWGENYPDVWPQVRQEWRGILTLDTLKQLRAFGRLES